ncbi:MAG: four-helix bundle copper-binding protein [Magnetococcales bacterium]|nr:four-helix bundle copper-binding protein [Magnetococcales bacterium]NGZ26570.1 four-helix bundle copper-binding protein [Magnetococcales bacterium]
MNRRDFITTTGAAAALFLAQAAQAEEKPMDHSGHHHPTPPNMALVQSAANCLVTGQVCLQHCMMLLSMGDTSLVECAKSVSDMLAVCTALQQLAVAKSPHLAAMAKVAADVCDACEKECRKHEAKHLQCKACADACKACSIECRKITA